MHQFNVKWAFLLFIMTLCLHVGELSTSSTVYDKKEGSLTAVPLDIPANTMEIVLANNDIQVISNASFVDLSLVWHLDLSNNEITSIPPHCFEGMPGLTKLSLKSNRIHTVFNTSLEGLHQLSSLSLRHNNLSTIPQELFRPTIIIKYLYLTGNQLQGMSVFYYYSCIQTVPSCIYQTLLHVFTWLIL